MNDAQLVSLMACILMGKIDNPMENEKYHEYLHLAERILITGCKYYGTKRDRG